MHTLSLFRTRRFAPIFWTQFLGTFNDSLFKNALVVGVAFQLADDPATKEFLVQAATGILILPFFTFSAIAGELADHFDKARLTRRLKVLEIGVMTVGALGFWSGNLTLLFGTLFCMGAQSAFFGPIKYSILPQHLKEDELVAGNGLVEAGTFAGVLLGTLAGGLLIAVPHGTYVVSAGTLVLAALGIVASRFIPAAPPVETTRLNLNPVTASLHSLRSARKVRSVWLSILALSWFWLFGALLLAQLPLLAKDVLGADEATVTWLLAVFSVGVGLGSISAERITGGRVELAMVPLAGLGIGAFALDLSLCAMTATGPSPRLFIDLFLVGVFGGLFAVPLYAVMQRGAPKAARSRVIAANNIINALFMVGAAIFALVLRGLGASIPQLIAITALIHFVVVVVAAVIVRRAMVRFVISVALRFVYRIRSRNLERIPETGPVVLVCNHPSLMDSILVGGLCKRPVRFVLYHKIYNIWCLRWFFDIVGAIPIAPKSEDPKLLKEAFNAIDQALAEGEVVAVFPEGGLTRTGDVEDFKPGIEHILKRRPVPVLPLALRGMWGSLFSHAGGPPMKKWPRRLFARVELVAGELLEPTEVSAPQLREQVIALRGDGP